MFQYVVPLAHSFYKIDWLRVKLKYHFVRALSENEEVTQNDIFEWKVFGIFLKVYEQTIITTQQLSQMSKSKLQKEWSYVVWDESADIWCCFSSFYSVQVRAEISGYPELSSRLWSFTRSCSMKNVLRLGFGIFHFHSVTQIFSHGAKKK